MAGAMCGFHAWYQNRAPGAGSGELQFETKWIYTAVQPTGFKLQPH
jgi:hypothetical protein